MNEIEESWQEAVRAVRAEYASLAAMLDSRYRRVVWSLLGVGAALIASLIFGLLAFRDVLNEQEASRREAIVSACEQRRTQSMTIRAFVARVAPKLEDEVKEGFAVEGDCEAYAARILDQGD